MRKGDRNTRFFRASMVFRRKRNYIWALRNKNGQILSQRNHMANYLRIDLRSFTSTELRIPTELKELILVKIDTEVSKEMARVPTREKVWGVVNEMHPLKAPGPNRMSGSFFRSYWNIVSHQVFEFVKECFT